MEAILNTDALTKRIREFQARGEHNPRHYDKYVWQVPIPLFDPQDARHQSLVTLAGEAERLSAGVQLPSGMRFEALRRVLRQALAASDVGKELEVRVAAILP